jgi:SRSO17 transposase
MERRFALRKEALVGEAQVGVEAFRGAVERLEKFIEPFALHLARREQVQHAVDFVAGLVSDLDRKNTESIAYRHDQERKDLQHFIGQSHWDHQPLIVELAGQVGRELGRSDAVLVFDPSGFPKKGTESVGVQRQWCGRLGKIDNCQVGVYMGYVSGTEHALVNMRLYLPQDWAKDSKRRKKCHVPRRIRFRTRHELCLEMLDETGHLLPHGWIAGDDEMGRSSNFRRELRARGERYLLAMPSNTLIRDLEAAPSNSRHDGTPRKSPFVRVDKWRESLPTHAWTTIDVRDGEKGPLIVEIVKRRVQAKTDRRGAGPEEVLAVIRIRDEQGAVKHDYYLSNAAPETELSEFARVAKAEHRIEDCLQRGKSEAGLADYEVRSWPGWYHHQTLSLIAAWFLNLETRRGKKIGTSHELSADPGGDRKVVAFRLPMRWSHADRPRMYAAIGTQPTCPLLSSQTPQPLSSLGFGTTTDLEQ